MSESYPKGSTWPFVLAGIVLFGMVICPPTEWRDLLVEVRDQWRIDEDPLAFPASPKKSRVVLGNHRRTTSTQAVPATAHATAPNRQASIRPSSVHTTKSISVQMPSSPTDGTRSAATQESSRRVDNAEPDPARVWQPPRGWQPTLIEPYPAGQAQAVPRSEPERVSAAVDLAPAAIEEPVAKLKSLPSTTRKRTIVADAVVVTPSSRSDQTDSPPPTIQEPEPSVPQQPRSATEEATPPSAKPESLAVVEHSQTRTHELAMSENLRHLLRQSQATPKLQNWSLQLQASLETLYGKLRQGEAWPREAPHRLRQLAEFPVETHRWTPAEQQLYWRTRYAVVRRADVLQGLAKTLATYEAHRSTTESQLSQFVTTLRARLKEQSSTSGWADYLLLDRLAASDQMAWDAEKTLERLRRSDCTPQQTRFLASEEFAELERKLRATISANVAPADLMAHLESYEQQTDPLHAQQFVAYLQRFATGPHADRYATTLAAVDHHYRNANLRVAVTEELMNRFVPAIHQYAEQVNDTILGAAVRGRNATQTNLSVQLIPDLRAIRVGLLANGMVDSDTKSRKGPVVFYNRGTSHFAAGKELLVNQNGIFLGETETRASTGNRVVRMTSDLDSFPVLGWLVRTVARQQHDEQRPFLRAAILQRVRRNASRKLDVEVQRRLAKVEDRLQSRVVKPLKDMDLDPRALELRTTSERVVVRTRLAGPLQLAAHTPRPKARADSMMSLQIHQSAANSLIQQLRLQGRRMTLRELIDVLADRLGMQVDVADKYRDMVFELAADRPLDVSFENDQVKVTIHFAELSNGEKTWRDFSVSGFFRADVRQLDVQLVRDGSIELITESLGLRDQIALRSIFTKVFANNHRLDVLRRAIQAQPHLRSLEVQQMTIRDGWIGISIGDEPSPRGATLARQKLPISR